MISIAYALLIMGWALPTGEAMVAQERTPAAVSATVAERFDALPLRVGGFARADQGYDRPMAAYRGTGTLAPLIVVVLTDAAQPITWREAAELSRAHARQAGLINTLFEGKFATPRHPAALTYFGDYLTKQGLQQTWIIEDRGIRLTVSATLYRMEDRRMVFDAIRKDLLDGAEITGRVTPADAN